MILGFDHPPPSYTRSGKLGSLCSMLHVWLVKIAYSGKSRPGPVLLNVGLLTRIRGLSEAHY